MASASAGNVGVAWLKIRKRRKKSVTQRNCESCQRRKQKALEEMTGVSSVSAAAMASENLMA